MVDRIREILRARQLTPTQFADTIGVARPIVSHILSGRNKPSLEVVQKIVEAFPDLSLAWILKGSGSMDGEQMPTATAVPAPALSTRRPALKAPETPRVAPNEAQPGVVATTSAGKPAERGAELYADSATRGTATEESAWPPPAFTVAEVASDNLGAAKEAGLPTTAAPDTSGNRVSLADTSNVSSATPTASITQYSTPASNAGLPPVAQALAEPGKKIRRIVIFYQDGTFTDYQPEVR